MNGKPNKYNDLNDKMNDLITALGEKLNLKINLSCGAPHTLRQGGCTDFARKDSSAWRNEMKDRWESERFTKMYISTD